MIADMKIGDTVKGKLLLTRIVERERKNSDEVFYEIHFCDESGKIEGREWDSSKVKNVEEGDIVNVSGKVVEYRGDPQITVQNIDKADNQDVDYSNYTKSTIVDYYSKILDFVDSYMKDDFCKNLSKFALKKFEKEIRSYPASRSNHHDLVGGLAKHIYSMLKLAESTVAHYTTLYAGDEYIDQDIIYASIVLHDIFKCREYSDPISCKMTEDRDKKGHILMIYEFLVEFAHREKLNYANNEKVEEIKHVVASHHGKKEWGSPVEPQTIEAELVHRLDMLDSRIDSKMEEK